MAFKSSNHTSTFTLDLEPKQVQFLSRPKQKVKGQYLNYENIEQLCCPYPKHKRVRVRARARTDNFNPRTKRSTFCFQEHMNSDLVQRTKTALIPSQVNALNFRVGMKRFLHQNNGRKINIKVDLDKYKYSMIQDAENSTRLTPHNNTFLTVKV